MVIPLKLAYSIHSSSGRSESFSAQHILHDTPFDARSRFVGSRVDVPSASPAAAADKNATSSDGDAGKGANSDRTSPPPAQQESQFVILKLDKPALVSAIGFGKFHKAHPCNLSEFVVSGGSSPYIMEPMFRGGLQNNSVNERFPLAAKETRKDVNGNSVLTPIKYIRIDCLAAHAPNYNVTIWHVWIEGDESEVTMDPIISSYENYRSLTSSHLILAHLRRLQLFEAFSTLFSTLSPSISSTFEHPLLSTLHEAFVIEGRVSGEHGAEAILDRCAANDLLLEQDSKLSAEWERLDPPPSAASTNARFPCPRAGHQMIRVGRTIYLHGGFDGTDELDDLWSYELPRENEKSAGSHVWRQIEAREERKTSAASESVPSRRKRPRARSCHQLAEDGSGWIYLLGGYRASAPTTVSTLSETPSLVTTRTFASGRLASYSYNHDAQAEAMSIDPEEPRSSIAGSLIDTQSFPQAMLASPSSTGGASARASTSENLYASDFWRFRPGRGGSAPVWELLSQDTALEYGPALLSDFQMFIDEESSTLFVFGGRVNEPTSALVKEVKRYSGMYTFNLITRKWRCEFGDRLAGLTSGLRSRVGHSMVFDSASRIIHISSGERDGQLCSDAWTIGPIPLTISSRPCNMLSLAQLVTPSASSPPPSFTQRFVLDATRRQWIAWSGLLDLDLPTDADIAACNQLWHRSATRNGEWDKVETRGAAPGTRFATPMVYDPLRDEYYILGGNPLDEEDHTRRLGDFWRLRVFKSSPVEALRKAKFLIRKQVFNEMCQSEPALDALVYLQTKLSNVVDHANDLEASAFRNCMTILLAAPKGDNGEDESCDEMQGGSSDATSDCREGRSRVFDEMMELFEERFTQPRIPLVDKL